MSKQEKIFESSCDSLNTCLYGLADLQNPVRMALAVRGVGPEAALYKNIKSVQASFPPDDGMISTGSDQASKRTTHERCPICGLMFPGYTLPSHQDSCVGPKVLASRPKAASALPTNPSLKDRINIHGRDSDLWHPEINDDELWRLW